MADSPHPADPTGSSDAPASDPVDPGHHEPSPAPADGADAGSDDVKARFREALERKQGRSTGAAGSGGGTGDRSGGGHTSGPHKAREFRRKSG
jgi:hypothetical protein